MKLGQGQTLLEALLVHILSQAVQLSRVIFPPFSDLDWHETVVGTPRATPCFNGFRAGIVSLRESLRRFSVVRSGTMSQPKRREEPEKAAHQTACAMAD